MAPAALRRGRNQAIIQATNCLKVLDAFRQAIVLKDYQVMEKVNIVSAS